MDQGIPHKPVTKKPAETRQGKGKGPVDHWVAVIKPGHVLFEIAGCSLTLAREALGLADAKLPFRCRLVTGNKTTKRLMKISELKDLSSSSSKKNLEILEKSFYNFVSVSKRDKLKSLIC